MGTAGVSHTWRLADAITFHLSGILFSRAACKNLFQGILLLFPYFLFAISQNSVSVKTQSG